jgi:ankyrin repeat protein
MEDKDKGGEGRRRGGLLDGLNTEVIPPGISQSSKQLEINVHSLAKRGSIQGFREAIFFDPFCIHERKMRTDETPLHIAVEFGRAEMVDFLLDAGADVSATTVQGMSPLHIAANKGDIAMAKVIIDACIAKEREVAELEDDVSIESSESLGKARRRPLLNKPIEEEKPLIELPDKWEVSCKLINGCYDKDWMTALHYASIAGHASMVEFLISEHGALPGMRTKSVGDDCLQLASFYGNLEVVEYLLTLKNRVALNIYVTNRNKHGNTCLHRACERGHTLVAQYLQRKGANLLTTNDADVTCIDLAEPSTIKELTPKLMKK